MSISQYPVASAGGASLFSRHTRFTTSGTFVHPDGATPKPVYVVTVSGGSGGASGSGGARAATGSVGCAPGYGGNAGCISDGMVVVSGAMTVVVGAGGIGGISTTFAFGNDGFTGNTITSNPGESSVYAGQVGGASYVVTSSNMGVISKAFYGPTAAFSAVSQDESHGNTGNTPIPATQRSFVPSTGNYVQAVIRTWNQTRQLNSLGSPERYIDLWAFHTHGATAGAVSSGKYPDFGQANGVWFYAPIDTPIGVYALAGTPGGEGGRRRNGVCVEGTSFAEEWSTLAKSIAIGYGGRGGYTVYTSDTDAVAGNGENGTLGSGGGGGGGASVFNMTVGATRNITIGGGGNGGSGYVDIFY